MQLIGQFKKMLFSLFILSFVAFIVEGLAATDAVIVSVYQLEMSLNILVSSFQYLFCLAFLVVAIGALVMLIVQRRAWIEALRASIMKRTELSNKGFLIRMLSSIASVCILFGVIWLFQSVKIKDFWGSIFKSGTAQSSMNITQSSSGVDTFASNSLISNLLLVSSALFLALVLAGGLLLLEAMREIREESREVPEQDALQKEAYAVVGKAISDIMIHEGNLDFRDAIIRCYQRLCELLAERKCQIKEHQTVQEFRISTLRTLRIPSEPFSELTDLFEEARYSLHEIDESKRNEALRCLTEIRNHMSGVN